MATDNEGLFDAADYVRPALSGFEPYDPAFTPCKINLSANENTHVMPPGFVEQLRCAATSVSLNRYPDPMANELRNELALRHGCVSRYDLCW